MPPAELSFFLQFVDKFDVISQPADPATQLHVSSVALSPQLTRPCPPLPLKYLGGEKGPVLEREGRGGEGVKMLKIFLVVSSLSTVVIDLKIFTLRLERPTMMVL